MANPGEWQEEIEVVPLEIPVPAREVEEPETVEIPEETEVRRWQ